MKLKEEREKALRALTREAIRKAVIHVMAAFGQDGITMQRVAEEAGVAKGTLYLYYKNKEELLEDTISWCFRPLVEGAREIFASDAKPDKKISQLITFHHTFFQEHQQLFQMLLVDQQCVRSNQNKQENDHHKKIIQKFSDLIQQGIDEGIFKKVNPMATAILLLGSSMELTRRFLNVENGFGLSPADSANVLKEIFLNGILV